LAASKESRGNSPYLSTFQTDEILNLIILLTTTKQINMCRMHRRVPAGSDLRLFLRRSKDASAILTFHVKSWKAEEKRVLAKVDYGRYSG